MASDAKQFELGFGLEERDRAATKLGERRFAGLAVWQLIVGALVLLGVVWAMWTTREVLALRQHKVVSVRLSALVNRFALAESRSGDDQDKVVARTHAFMSALDQALNARSKAGEVVLVGEAVVSSSSDDITAAVAADVARQVPMPAELPLPPRAAVAPVPTTPPIASVATLPGAPGAGGSNLATGAGFGPAPAGGQVGGADLSGEGAVNEQQ